MVCRVCECRAGKGRDARHWQAECPLVPCLGAQTSEPKQGDIVVLWRGSRDAATGHVGFFSGFDAAGNVLILGGNQDNKVSVEAFERNRVLSFRRATTNTI